jgi:hypothetical protein
MKKIKGPPKILSYICLCFVIAFGLITIVGSGGGGGDGSNGDSNIGWLSIESFSVILNNEGEAYADINGTAFESPDYTAHKHGGICFILCSYDDSYPGVDVSWKNQTNSINGTATSRYGTKTNWDHIWHASIPLILGNNDIVITSSDPAGNHGSDSMIVEYLPPAPLNLSADSSNGQITLIWGDISGADSYNIYWSTEAGVTKVTGTKIANVTSPYVHSGLINGVTYYYVITSFFTGIESGISNEVSAVPGAPERPGSVMAEASNGDIIISWADVSTATSYNLYWANEPNVTKDTGNLVSGVTSPYVHTGLIGIPYYYVMTAVNSYGESLESLEVEVMPQLPPPAPTNLTATNRPNNLAVDIEWEGVPEVSYYNLFRCRTPWISIPGGWDIGPCQTSFEIIYTGTDTLFVDWNLTDGDPYRYHVIAVNSFGESNPSEDVKIVAGN